MFGNGRHAWLVISSRLDSRLINRLYSPGRFLVSALLKTMLVRVLLTYDIKLEDEGVRPPDKWFTFAQAPNETAGLMFRKRAVTT